MERTRRLAIIAATVLTIATGSVAVAVNMATADNSPSGNVGTLQKQRPISIDQPPTMDQLADTVSVGASVPADIPVLPPVSSNTNMDQPISPGSVGVPILAPTPETVTGSTTVTVNTIAGAPKEIKTFTEDVEDVKEPNEHEKLEENHDEEQHHEEENEVDEDD